MKPNLFPETNRHIDTIRQRDPSMAGTLPNDHVDHWCDNSFTSVGRKVDPRHPFPFTGPVTLTERGGYEWL